jgi:hypothetical protein
MLPFEHGERKPALIQRNGAKVPSGAATKESEWCRRPPNDSPPSLIAT